MEKSSYLKNYIQIYFWQFVAVLMNFLSFFIVTPLLSDKPAIFGVYSLCVSLNIFFAYADIGFVSAGFKFASEFFAMKDIKKEIEITGFAGFILLLMIIPGAVAILFFAYDPRLIISNIATEHIIIASRLLYVLAFFSPLIILQRVVLIIFGVRVEDYIFRQISTLGHILKIVSVLYFFRGEHYEVVGYYLFVQVINVMSFVVAIIVAKNRYGYDFAYLLKCFRFSRNMFDRTKALAFASVISTITWVLYYEFDSIAISKLIGVRGLANYSAGLTILSFLRTIMGTFFSPFNARFNHVVGTSDEPQLKSFYSQVVITTLPLTFFPLVSIVLLMEPLILSWLGDQYRGAILPTMFLVSIYIGSHISYPAGILLVAKLRTKFMNFLSLAMATVFWGGILLTYRDYGIMSFAFFKCIGFGIAFLGYIYYSQVFLCMSPRTFVKTFYKDIPIPLFVMWLLVYLVKPHLTYTKSAYGLVYVVCCGVATSFVSIVVYYYISSPFRINMNYVFKKLFLRFFSAKSN